jgi:hypothetical protein
LRAPAARSIVRELVPGPITLVARRPRWPWIAAAISAAAVGAIAWPRAPEAVDVAPPPAVAGHARVAPARPAWVVVDPPAPAELPAWATRPDRPARRIAGRVVGNDGAPVRASVHLRLADHAELWRGRDVATDARGRFDLGVLPAGAYHLVAEAPGLGSRVVDVSTDGTAGDLAQAGDDVELIARPCGVVRGEVRALGAPVVGARVTHGGVVMAHSDARGRFELCATEAWIDVRAPGLALISPNLLADQPDGAIVATMWPTQRFTGRIVDERGAPQVGALLGPTIDDPGPLQYDRAASAATTDADGRFAFELPDPTAAGGAPVPRDYEVWFRANGRFDVVLGMSDARAVAPLELTARAADLIDDDRPVYVARLRGRVVRGGRPVADGWVDAEPASGGPGASTRTRSDGSFELALTAEQLGDVEIDAAGADADHDPIGAQRVRVRAGDRLRVRAFESR